MNVSVLHIDDCPNWFEAGSVLRTALDNIGLPDTKITFTVLRSSTGASQVPFASSPTILVDGLDLFPTDGSANDLAGRIYKSEGHFAGRPSLAEIEDALRKRQTSSALNADRQL